MKRSRKRRPKRASKLAAVAASAAGPSRGFSRDSSVAEVASLADADPLADARIRPLLERYCGLAGVKQAALGSDHVKLSLPQAEQPFFRDRERLSVAFSLDALERDPDAEIAVLGSPFLSQLIEAIRTRAARLSLGLAVHPVGRLVARVVLRAGAGVEEAVVESDVYDLATGARLSDDLAGAFRDLEESRVEPANPADAGKASTVPAREPGDLLRLLLNHLQEKSAERVAARRAAAEQALATELGRLDRYFESILKEQSDPEAIGTVTALAERRRTEEIRRSQVKAVVAARSVPRTSAATTVSRSVAWTSNRRATSTCASVLRVACSIARPTKGSAPRTGTPPARRASRRAAAAAGSCATGTPSRAARMRRREAGVSVRRASSIVRAAPTSRWARTK